MAPLATATLLTDVDGDDVDPADGQASLLAMGDDDLVVALQRALGNVRLFNLLDAMAL